MRIWSCWFEEECQLGKPGPTGKPSSRIERRSGENMKLKDLIVENSASVGPSATGILDFLRWLMRIFGVGWE